MERGGVGRPVSGDRSGRRGDRQTDRHRGKCERWEVGGALLKRNTVNAHRRGSQLRTGTPRSGQYRPQ